MNKLHKHRKTQGKYHRFSKNLKPLISQNPCLMWSIQSTLDILRKHNRPKISLKTKKMPIKKGKLSIQINILQLTRKLSKITSFLISTIIMKLPSKRKKKPLQRLLIRKKLQDQKFNKLISIPQRKPLMLSLHSTRMTSSISWEMNLHLISISKKVQ